MGKEDMVVGNIDHGLQILLSRGLLEISGWQSFCSVFFVVVDVVVVVSMFSQYQASLQGKLTLIKIKLSDMKLIVQHFLS
jgi:hypothetical protein